MVKNKSKTIIYPLVTALSFFTLAIIMSLTTPTCQCFYGKWGAYVAYILAEVAIIKLIIINFIVDKSNIRHKSFVLWVLLFIALILYLVFFLVIIGLGEKYTIGGPY